MDDLMKKMIENEEKKGISNKLKNLENINNTKDETPKKIKTKYDVSIDEFMGKEKPPEDDVIVIIQDGGIGDAICAAPMLESARKIYKNKKLVYAAFYKDVFLNNPNIDYLYPMTSPGDLYEKWIKKLRYNSSILKHDLYNSGLHKIFPGKLSELICYKYGVPYPGDNLKVYLTEGEENEAIKFIKSFPRPVILIQPYGSKYFLDPKVKLTTNKDWFTENWVELVSLIQKDFDVVQVGGRDEEPIKGVTTYLMGMTNIRQTMAVAKHSLSFVSIDTLLNHVGPAVGKSGVVLFGRSNPFIFGHDMNINVWVDNSCELNDMHCGRPQTYFGDAHLYRGVVKAWECPDRSCMRAVTPEMVHKALFKAIEKNTREGI